MSKVLRSPKAMNLQHALSDSDVTTIASMVLEPPSFISQRNKRQRKSSEEQLCSFKEEIKNMLDEWKGTQNALLNKLISEVSQIKEQNNQIKQTNDEIEKSLVFINNQYEDMKKAIEVLEAERKQHLFKITSLESAIEDLQRSSKSSSIELRNIPISPEMETKAFLSGVVKNMCKAININVQDGVIRDVFRVNGKSGKGTIVAEFTSVITKNDVIQGAKAYNKHHPDNRLNSADIGFKGQPTPVFISEALTNKGRRLFFLARDLAKSMEYKFCWTANGKIFIRKDTDTTRIEIRDESQLVALRNNM